MVKEFGSANQMIILTYNVEYGNRIEEIYKWIKNLEKLPDIICLQEFPEKEIHKLEKNKLFKKQSISFIKGLSKKEEIFGELTVFDASKIELIDTTYIDFGADQLESIYKRKLIKRSAIINNLKIENKIISIANVHLTPLSLHGKRKKQLEKVIKNINENKSIILGDFNYSSLLTRGGLVNFMKSHRYVLAGEKIVTNKYKYTIPQQLDYIFYKNLGPKEVKVLDAPYSDHFPVIAEFRI